MPGPPVAVCEGDLLSVEVNNHLHTETTTVHFHGKYLLFYSKILIKVQKVVYNPNFV